MPSRAPGELMSLTDHEIASQVCGELCPQKILHPRRFENVAAQPRSSLVLCWLKMID